MARNGNMLGVGGTRSNLSRSALRGGGRGAGHGAGDAAAQKRELLRRLQDARTVRPDASETSQATDAAEAPGAAGAVDQHGGGAAPAADGTV
ncbi:DUF6243 family protein [Streptomyces sp. JNUCC 64]